MVCPEEKDVASVWNQAYTGSPLLFAVGHTHRVVASSLELVLVWDELVDGLFTKSSEELILSLRVDGERSRNPWTAEDVGWEN